VHDFTKLEINSTLILLLEARFLSLSLSPRTTRYAEAQREKRTKRKKEGKSARSSTSKHTPGDRNNNNNNNKNKRKTAPGAAMMRHVGRFDALFYPIMPRFSVR